MSEWVVPGYTELKELGSGGFGAVVLARHDATGTPVAIKYLRAQHLGDPEVAELFRREAITLSSLDDPHVTRLYEYVEGPPGAAIVMELVDGVTLREMLTRYGKTSPEAALVVLYGSLLGLAAAHARGVVHRDYKPTNVLVNAYGASKLTDFGIAVLAGTDVPTGATAAYAPPEQWDAAPASPASDVYAATVTFYECLTGARPFTGQSDQTLASQHRYGAVPMAPVPGPLRPLVARGMAKDPQYRPADAAALAAELRAVAAGAYGQDWENRGRSQLGEAALLLAALWPTAGVPALQGTTIEQARLGQQAQGSHNVQGSHSIQGSHSAQGSQSQPTAHAAQGSQGQPASRAELHRWHVGHVRHEEHLEHLRYVGDHGGRRVSGSRMASRIGGTARAAGVVVAAAAAAAAIGTVAATAGSRSSSGSGSAGHPAVAAYSIALNGSHSVVPGEYLINRQISDDPPWILTLAYMKPLPSGQAEFFITYANTGATASELTCTGTSIGDETLTFNDGQVIQSIADFCSQHPSVGNFSVGAGQSHLDYVIFPDENEMTRQPFTFNWPARGLAGQIRNLQLPGAVPATAAAAAAVAATATPPESAAATPAGTSPSAPATASSVAGSCAFGSVCVAANGALTGGAVPEQYANDPDVHVAGLNAPPAAVAVTVGGIPASGTYTLSVWYENYNASDGLIEPRDMSLLVNGQPTGTLDFAVTGSWYETHSLVTTANVQVPAGNSTFTIACQAGDSCHLNIWKIELK